MVWVKTSTVVWKQEVNCVLKSKLQCFTPSIHCSCFLYLQHVSVCHIHVVKFVNEFLSLLMLYLFLCFFFSKWWRCLFAYLLLCTHCASQPLYVWVCAAYSTWYVCAFKKGERARERDMWGDMCVLVWYERVADRVTGVWHGVTAMDECGSI